MKTTVFTYTLDTIDSVAQNVLKTISTKTVLFYGNMGAGKTTLIKALLNAMGSTDTVTSPTFSIVNEYEISNDKVYHFDFYRIESVEDAYNFGIEEYLNSKHWLFIEWPDKIASILPSDATGIEIKTLSPLERTITLSV